MVIISSALTRLRSALTLMMVCVRGAVRAVVAVDGLARIALVAIRFQVALGNLEVRLWDDLLCFH